MAADKSSGSKKPEAPKGRQEPPSKPSTGEAAPVPRPAGLIRPRSGIWLAGVCEGLGAVTKVPALVWRLVFLVLTLTYGIGVIIYGALWLTIKPEPAGPTEPAPLFRPVDWITMLVTGLLVFAGYMLSIAPDLTLEDCGELAVGSYYAGVPHPPGYPVWTIYTWLFTVILPVSNIAWRVAVSSAFAGAASCGLIALMVSRGSSMMLEGIKDFKDIDRRWESGICAISGYVAGMLMGFNGFFWSQAVIVEVYTLSVFSLVGVLVLLMRWLYAPDQRRFLYWAMFIFGICFTNHQTLIVAATGIEVLILCRDIKLGRDLFICNAVIYGIGLIMKGKGMISAFDSNPGEANVMFIIFNIIGVSSGAVGFILWVKTQKFLTEWKPVLIMAALWALGAAFYFYMPIASMTNPPLNWGYPRTVEGFKHALTRGQYEKANPTNFLKDPVRFAKQLWGYAEGAMEEFNEVYILFALVPFVFLTRMPDRERAWIIGLSAIYLCLAVLLVILLNPQPDRQSIELNRVFFTSSHVMIAMGIGYGLAIIAGLAIAHYAWFRSIALAGGAVWLGRGLYELLVEVNNPMVLHSQIPIVKHTAIFFLALAILTVLILAIYKAPRTPIVPLLVVFTLMPIHSIMAHWWDNEQRGHLFGFWFGHDMFTPPFSAPDGTLSYDSKLRAQSVKDPIKAKLTYPEMAKDAVLFGGTDPGRFNPTYMIFCESFIKASQRRNPEFDRRDVYIITQNALADATYLSYIRAHYNRSAQPDPRFFQELFRGTEERTINSHTNPIARVASVLDDYFIKKGADIEARRRAEGVYPPKEILTPSAEDSQKSFEDYVQDAGRRAQLNQLRPGEDVRVEGNKLQVSGQVAVMAINGLLTKVIFDKNPTHEFYVEESFPLDWMYPYLTPFGIIMKINRQPLIEITDDVVLRDSYFWSQYSDRLTGNWINDKTTVKELTEWADRVYVRGDFSNFKGDPKFIRDDNAQKAFSKLRSAVGGLYVWRINHCSAQLQALMSQPQTNQAAMQAERTRLQVEQNRMVQAADFAFKQSLSFCPYSPEAVYRYVNLLTSLGRFEDALLIVANARKLDPNNGGFKELYDSLSSLQSRPGAVPAVQPAGPPSAAAPTQQAPQMVTLQSVEQAYKTDPTNLQNVAQLASAYMQLQRTNESLAVIKKFVDLPGLDPMSLVNASQIYVMLHRGNEALAVADRVAAMPGIDANTLAAAANLYGQIGQGQRLESTLKRLVTLIPDSPEAWYDLAAIQASLQKNPDAAASLKQSLDLSDKRLVGNPKERDIRSNAVVDQRFQTIRQMPEHKALFEKK